MLSMTVATLLNQTLSTLPCFPKSCLSCLAVVCNGRFPTKHVFYFLSLSWKAVMFDSSGTQVSSASAFDSSFFSAFLSGFDSSFFSDFLSGFDYSFFSAFLSTLLSAFLSTFLSSFESFLISAYLLPFLAISFATLYAVSSFDFLPIFYYY